ncbi:unnamed protein product, partial [Polarella glacialis]
MAAIRPLLRCSADAFVASCRCFRGTRQGFADEDPYAILGVRIGASASEVRAAYLRAALQTHPDVLAAGAEAKQSAESDKDFRQILDAYQRLRAGAWSPSVARRPYRPAEGGAGPWATRTAHTDGRPPFSAVSQDQADKLFRAVFGGRGVEDMLKEEFDRLGVKPGVHGAVVREGIFARLLREARLLKVSSSSRARDSRQHEGRESAAVPEQPPRGWPRVEVDRQPVAEANGARSVR